MWMLLLVLSFPVFSQIDLSAIQELDNELPNYTEYKLTPEEIEIQRQNRRFVPPVRSVSLEEIKQSGTQLGAVPAGVPLRKMSGTKSYQSSKMIYINFYKLEDEFGFKYIKNQNGTVTWRIQSRYVEPIKEALVMHVPPHRYTPAPKNIIHADYDKKLSLPPELSFYAGVVQGDYMKDLFNDAKASEGVSNQYGLHFFTNWKLPVKAGAVLHYERSSYHLSGGGQIIYSAISIGPQFKTRDFEVLGQPLRFQTQFRFSPLARASAELSTGELSYKFNSADLMAGIERPIKNRFGEFVLGLYLQTQWLNIKEQEQGVSVEASNSTNKSFGLSFSQVFQ